MQPESFSPCFIATDYGRHFWQAKAVFGLGNFVEHTLWITRSHVALARFLTWASREAELPGLFAQFKGHKQGHLGYITIRLVGRCGCHWLFPPEWSISNILE